MKKTTTVLFLVASSVLTFGQLNPVKNLSCSHNYVVPYNCYHLSWQEPDATPNDSVIGYNIYRNDELYRFTQYLWQSCDPCNGDTAKAHCENFYDYNNGRFYMHVTAVYSGNKESGYTDSLDFGGIAIGIEEKELSPRLVLSPNPSNGVIQVQAEGFSSYEKGVILDRIGRVVMAFDLLGSRTRINCADFSAGLYMVRILKDGNYVGSATKLLIEH